MIYFNRYNCLDKVKENKGFFTLLGIYFVLFVMDFVTTLRMGQKILPILELNPVYRLLGSLWPIIIINLLVIIWILWLYLRKKTKSVERGYVMFAMTLIIIMRVIAISNAVVWHNTNLDFNSPQVVQELSKTYTEEYKIKYMTSIVITNYLPFIAYLFAFWLWSQDHELRKKHAR